MKGRKPLPQEILNLRGTERNDRKRPMSAGIDRIMPDQMNRCQVAGLNDANARAKRIYWSTCKRLACQGILDPSYLPQVLMYAIQYDFYLRCCEDIEKNGLYVQVHNDMGEVSSVVENPAIRNRNKSVEILMKIGSNFGMSPVDRQRIKMQEDPREKRVKSIMARIDYEDSVDDQQ